MPNQNPPIDILENSLRRRGRILDILLTDRTRTTERKTHNIIWATDSYTYLWHKKRGKNPYCPEAEIQHDQITGMNGNLIQPRAAKSREEQRARTKDKAEVFTPLSVVKQMNNDVMHSLSLPKDHTWHDFIAARWLEIACGEAPFIASRYNPVASTQKIIKPENRVGVLDEKLKLVNKYCNSKDEWLANAEIALKACYGYEWQGDSLLIARENILMTMNDFYKIKFESDPNIESQAAKDGGLTTEQLEHFAEIASWNIFQMDGLRYVIPMTCKNTTPQKPRRASNTLFDMSKVPVAVGKSEQLQLKTKQCPGCRTNNPTKHNGVYVKIMDWHSSKTIKFYKLAQS